MRVGADAMMDAVPGLIGDITSAIDGASEINRNQMLSRLTTHFMKTAPMLDEPEVDMFDIVFVSLSGKCDRLARVDLSETIASVPNGPKRTIIALAFDDEIDIAGPVIRRSPRLEETDLVLLVRQKGQPHLLAVTTRPALTEPVTDILVERGDVPVLQSLARNRSAALSGKSAERMAKTALYQEDLREAMAWREDLSAALKKAEQEERVQRASGTTIPAGAWSAMLPDETDNALAPATPSAPSSQVHVLDEAEHAIVGALATSSLDRAIMLIAGRLHVPFSTVARAFATDVTGSFLCVLRAANVSWPTCERFLRIRLGETLTPFLSARCERQFLQMARPDADRAVRMLNLRDRRLQN